MDDLAWTREPAVRAVTEEERIDEEINGKAPDSLVSIYDGAIEDVEASERDGRKRYKVVTMVAVRNFGEKDFAPHQLRDGEPAKFPRAWKAYEQRKSSPSWHRLELLPGINAAHLCELAELGVRSIEALAEFDGDLFEVAALRERARVILRALKPRLRMVEGSLQEVA
jgi:hypothetical protein